MNLYSPLVNRNITQNVASKMSRSAAKPAVTHAKMRLAVRVNFSLLPALPAAVKHGFHLSQSLTALYIAANASPK